MSRARIAALAAAGVVLSGCVLSAQEIRYLEAAPRRPGVELPDAALEGNARAARALGILTREAAAREALRSGRDETGTRSILVILALFSDSPEPRISSEAVSRVLFDGPAEPGTLTEFFAESSGGRLTVTGQVTSWIRTGVSLLEAAGEVEGHGFVGERSIDYVREAVIAADERVDYGRFDNDGPDGVPNSGDDDGRVDAVVVAFPEPTGACGGPGIWPHLGFLSDETGASFPTEDEGPDGEPIRVSSYIVDSAADCEGDDVKGMSVVAHEFGHVLGLPDWYRSFAPGSLPPRRFWNIGCFGLMGAGTWGCGTDLAADFGPTDLSPLSKLILGWLDPLEVEPTGEAMEEEFLLQPVRESRRVLILPLRPESFERFIVEYRPRQEFDAVLPAGGVLIYHWDTTPQPPEERDIPPDLPPFSRYHLVEADADHALRKLEEEGGDRGVASDVFGAGGAERSLSSFTEPSTRDHTGRPSDLRLPSVRVEGGVARVRVAYETSLQVDARDIPATVTVLEPFAGTLELRGGTPPFAVEIGDGSLPVGISPEVAGREVSLVGIPRQAGSFLVQLNIDDAIGKRAAELVRFSVEDLEIPAGDLLEALLPSPSVALGEEERGYLDLSGNQNGRFDIGDFRGAVLRRGLAGEGR